MVKVRFLGYSSLYGYSYIWLMRLFVLPSLSFPNLNKTKNPFIILEIPIINKLFEYNFFGFSFSSYKSKIINIFSILRKTLIICHVILLTQTVVVVCRNQQTLLSSYGLELNENHFSYKVAYYMPIFYVSIRIHIYRTN